LETIFWYYLAPGIDPQSRWFNPLDGELIVGKLLNPSTVFSPTLGSGLSFSSLLLNSFLILPMVWALLLLQEDDNNNNNNSISATSMNNGHQNQNSPPKPQIAAIAAVATTSIKFFACAAGFFVGGGALIPYMVLRRPMPFRRSIDPDQFPAPLRIFEQHHREEEEEEEENSSSTTTTNSTGIAISSSGPIFLLALTSLVVVTFLFPFVIHSNALSSSSNNNINYDYDWIIEWNAFLDRAHNSQFTALALFDFTMISITILDPMMDDALRRGYVAFDSTSTSTSADADADADVDANDTILVNTAVDNIYNGDKLQVREARGEAVRKLAPFVVIPLIGPVAWICLRPRYSLRNNK